MKPIYQLILTLFSLIAAQVNAQLNPAWLQTFKHTQSTNFSNESRKVVTDSNGNIFVLADVTSDIDINGNVVPTTEHYTVILKYNSAGTLLTSRNILVFDHNVNGFDHPGGFGLEVDGDDNIYVGYNIYNGISNYNVAVAKHNNNLIRLWAYTFNPLSLDEGVDIRVSASGLVYALAKSTSVSGTQYSIILCDSAAISGTTPLYAFSSNTEVLRSMTVDANNEVYVTGYQLVSGYQSIMTARVNSGGTLKWKRIYNAGSSNRNDIGNKIIHGPSQDVYIVGTSDRGAPLGDDGVVLKYQTSNGRFEWVSFLDFNNGNESGVAVDIYNPTVVHAAIVSGNKIITVRMTSSRGQQTGRNTYEPIPLTTYNSLDSVSVTEFKCSPSNNIYICGNVYAKDVLDKNFEGDFLVKLVPVTGRFAIDDAFKTDEELPIQGSAQKSQRVTGMALDFNFNSVYTAVSVFEDYSSHLNESVRINAYNFASALKTGDHLSQTETNLMVYPNPANDKLNVFNVNGLATVELLNLTGQTLLNLKLVDSNNVTLQLEEFSAGIYFVKVTDSFGEITTQKVIKN